MTLLSWKWSSNSSNTILWAKIYSDGDAIFWAINCSQLPIQKVKPYFQSLQLKEPSYYPFASGLGSIFFSMSLLNWSTQVGQQYTQGLLVFPGVLKTHIYGLILCHHFTYSALFFTCPLHAPTMEHLSSTASVTVWLVLRLKCEKSAVICARRQPASQTSNAQRTNVEFSKNKPKEGKSYFVSWL